MKYPYRRARCTNFQTEFRYRAQRVDSYPCGSFSSLTHILFVDDYNERDNDGWSNEERYSRDEYTTLNGNGDDSVHARRRRLIRRAYARCLKAWLIWSSPWTSVNRVYYIKFATWRVQWSVPASDDVWNDVHFELPAEMSDTFASDNCSKRGILLRGNLNVL